VAAAKAALEGCKAAPTICLNNAGLQVAEAVTPGGVGAALVRLRLRRWLRGLWRLMRRKTLSCQGELSLIRLKQLNMQYPGLPFQSLLN